VRFDEPFALVMAFASSCTARIASGVREVCR
jgi:hypothetical protein